MRIINGLNYYEKLDIIIKECIQKAQEYPYRQFIFIVEDKEMIEKRFFQYTHFLVNIEIMTWNQYLYRLMLNHHFTYKQPVNNIELTYYLRQILNNNDFYCFHDVNYSLINEMISLMKELELHQTFYEINSNKLKDYMKIYHCLKEYLGNNKYLCLESLFQNIQINEKNIHLYVEADHLYQQARQNILQNLSLNNDMTLLYTHNFDSRLFNKPLHHLCLDANTYTKDTYLTKNLFSQTFKHNHQENKFYTFKASTPQNEVKRVVYTLLEDIVDKQLHYNDFIIVYPNESYKEILLDTLSKENIPHNIKKTTSCLYDKDYQNILNILESTDITQSVQDWSDNLSKEMSDNKYKDYFLILKDFDELMSSEEFKDFFISTCQLDRSECFYNDDQVQVVSIDKVKSDRKKHIFILGMNETVLPSRFKDTGLLLDEDIELLRKNHIPTSFTSLELLGMHQNDILKAIQCPYERIVFSYAYTTQLSETLLSSSLYNQLNKMYDLKPLKENKYLPLDEYYLNGGRMKEKEILNQNITNYIETQNQPLSINKEIIKKLYSPVLSVSQIETYNKCPFLYFIQYGLGVYPLKEEKLLPNELGSLVHYILSINMKKDKSINDLVQHYLSKNQDLKEKIYSSSINQYFIEQLSKDLEITLKVLHQMMDISLFKIYSEEEKVEDRIKDINFKGFVDRMDVYDHYLSIIDYKSSAKDIDLSLAIQGFNIQMLLYLKMMTKKYDSDPGAVLYFNTKRRIMSGKGSISENINEDDFYGLYKYGGYVIDDNTDVIQAIDPSMNTRSNLVNVNYVKSRGEYKGHIMSTDTLNQLMEMIEEHIYELYTYMINGNIEIAPKGSDDNNIHQKVNPCRYCHYHSVCHFDVFYNEYNLVKTYDINEILGRDD